MDGSSLCSTLATSNEIIPSWGSKYQVRSSAVNQDGSISDSEDEDEVDNRSDAGELNVDDILDFD